jgi:NitT/TauT family transport system substrate-binding protein
MVRVGLLQFGTVQWIADVIRRNRLDESHGFRLQAVTLANTEAGRIGLMAGAADIVVSDWLFAAAQRAAGTPLCFVPFSNAMGGIMVRADSPLRELADLKGRKLGVAGGPTDKSWLLVRAASRAQGTDLAEAARVVYSAPPLLNAKLLQGELDAVLTYWNFAARLEAERCRELVSVATCAEGLGLPRTLGLVGFVFRQDWAERDRAAVNGFFAAVREADNRLAESPGEWEHVRPLMDAPDEALFTTLRRRYLAGVAHLTAEQQERTDARLLEILLRTGGPSATAGLERVPEGIFWPVPDDAA